MLKCKNCGGFVYEEESYIDDNKNKIIQLGCYQCSHKAYVENKKWQIFKRKLNRATKANAKNQ